MVTRRAQQNIAFGVALRRAVEIGFKGTLGASERPSLAARRVPLVTSASGFQAMPARLRLPEGRPDLARELESRSAVRYVRCLHARLILLLVRCVHCVCRARVWLATLDATRRAARRKAAQSLRARERGLRSTSSPSATQGRRSQSTTTPVACASFASPRKRDHSGLLQPTAVKP